jgi:hypothetical protein
MAIGINPVNRPQEKRRGINPVDRDLNRILAAVQIGQAAFGIKEQLTTSDLEMEQIKTEQERQKEIIAGAALKSQQTKTSGAQEHFTKAKTKTQGILQQKEQENILKTKEDTKRIQALTRKANADVLNDLSNKNWTKSKDLRSQWEKSPITQRSIRISNSWKQMQQLAAQGTGGSDDAFIFLYNKMLDETSAVMPGEVNRVSETGSVVDRANQIAQNWIKGSKLDSKVKQEFVEAGGIITNIQSQVQNAWDNELSGIANKNNLDSSQVVLKSIVDFGATGGIQSNQQQTGFSDDAVKQVMEGANVDRATAIQKLKAAQGGTQ